MTSGRRKHISTMLLLALLAAWLATGVTGATGLQAQPQSDSALPSADETPVEPPPPEDAANAAQWQNTAPPGARITPEGWFPPRQFAEPPSDPGTIYVIPIHGPIMDSAFDRVVRMKVAKAVRNGARIIVFDMNTPGGRLDVTERVMSIITRDLRDVFTVAYVNHKAISAGALISVACDRIYVTPNSSIGDARPVNIGSGSIDPGDRAKIESYWRALVREPAQAAGYNIPMVEAMISLNIEVWLIRHRQTGQLQMVNATDWAGRLPGVDSSALLTPPRATTDSRTPGEWEFVRVLVGDSDMLTMTTSEAQFAGFTDAAVPSRQALAEQLGATDYVFVADDLGQRIARFLTNFMVQFLLFVGLIFFVYMEFQEPGLGLFGGLALFCLVLLVGGRYFVGLAEWWEIALIVIGLILIALEIFVIPGFGVAGISGIVLVVLGLIFSAVPSPPGEWPLPTNETAVYYLRESLLILGLGFIVALVLIVVAARNMKRMPLGSKLVLADVPRFDEPPTPDDSPMHTINIGDLGTVEATLRPVGKVRIGDALCDAVAESAFIEAGAKVRVLQHDGNRLVVEKVGEA